MPPYPAKNDAGYGGVLILIFNEKNRLGTKRLRACCRINGRLKSLWF